MSRPLLSQLRIGEAARIEAFTDDDLAERLMELGCLPGEIVRMIRKAPLGDPLIISIGGTELSLRKAEASTVIIAEVNV